MNLIQMKTLKTFTLAHIQEAASQRPRSLVINCHSLHPRPCHVMHLPVYSKFASSLASMYGLQLIMREDSKTVTGFMVCLD